MANLGIRDASRLLLGAVDRSFFRLAASDQRVNLAREVLVLNERLAAVAQRQLVEGGISRLDYNLAVVELGRSKSRHLTARREYEQAASTLRTLLGLSAGTLIPVVEETRRFALDGSTRNLQTDSLVILANSRRPDLLRIDRAVVQADALEKLSRREGLPNLVLRGVSELSATSGRRIFRPALGLSLPFFNRNQGSTQAERARGAQARLGQTALLASIRGEIVSEVSAYLTGAAEVEVFESSVLAPARQNRELAEAAYREGKVGLPIVLLIRNQAIEAELDYWNAWLAEREAFANLEEATGQNIVGVNVSDGTRRNPFTR